MPRVLKLAASRWFRTCISRANLLRIGIALGWAYVCLHDDTAKRLMYLFTRPFGSWCLLAVFTAIGVTADFLIVVGWRRLRSQHIDISRMERGIAILVAAISTMMVVGDLVFTFLIRRAIHQMMKDFM
jgi:hypothetical protein